MSDEASAEVASPYAQMHLAGWVPVHYDEVMYATDSYDTFIWGLERPFLRSVAGSLTLPAGDALRYLDFACGTGRITCALEDLAIESLGVDISPDMVSAAEAKSRHSSFSVGDILEHPGIAPGPYDLITAMRFFVNTEDEMRTRVMPALSAKLAGRHSRLVFNVHMNTINLLPAQLYRRLHGWPPYRSMTYWQAKRLVRDAGLDVVEVHGFGFLPSRLHRGPLAGISGWVDRRLSGRTPFNWLCRDLVFVCRPR